MWIFDDFVISSNYGKQMPSNNYGQENSYEGSQEEGPEQYNREQKQGYGGGKQYGGRDDYGQQQEEGGYGQMSGGSYGKAEEEEQSYSSPWAVDEHKRHAYDCEGN